ncbi:hypothetical protein GOARA_012_00790 [Gordonia araii NBRC 100433]|uniref:DUF4386 family protein n=1 Tax=Gordonia araii NBRC 100433 TaxID=1073574 RepID=G7GY54_9ACTN|nr:hypothetical protein [Gordonia araii]GAB08529.1 hypothetical protein GOARA_012_00790 [Gordonia araii NBRC 100433]
MPLRALETPRAAALAGVVFALLFGVALSLVHLSMPGGFDQDAEEFVAPQGRLTLAVALMPFAGIAYLWFVAVVRDGFGQVEDRFYSTVFMASSLLFLAMIFVAVAVAAGLGNVSGDEPESAQQAVVEFGSGIVGSAGGTFALRMAAVSMMSLATIWLKSGVMQRWLVIVSYATAVILLVASNLSVWISLLYPVWALIISLSILFTAFAERDDEDPVAGGVRG